jgi:hypothetical protein
VFRFETLAQVLHTWRMTHPPTSNPDGSEAADQDESAATEAETRATLLERSKRDAAPLLKAFVQNPDRTLARRNGPLSVFVQHADLRALKAFLFLHAIISSGEGANGWSTTLPLAAWARAFDTTKSAELRSASSAATKILSRLVDRKLISRGRVGRARKITVTLLRPDGSGAAYTRPGKGNDDRFLKLSNAYWTEGWHEKLDLPATAMLLVALHEKDGFELVTERVPDWYGWSADTAERGLKTLEAHGLIRVDKRYKKTPLSPSGRTLVNIYTLIGPFAHPSPTAAAKSSTSKKTTTTKKTTAKKSRKKTLVKRASTHATKRKQSSAPTSSRTGAGE